MSDAKRCDACDVFYPIDQRGSIQIEGLHVLNGNPDGESSTWGEIDLCHECAAPILKELLPACTGLDELLKPKEEKPA